MLSDLLERLRAGGTRRVTDLARELGTTPELVEMMLEDLARMGYLKPLGQACADKCSSCSMTGLCTASGAGGRMWALADRDDES